MRNVNSRVADHSNRFGSFLRSCSFSLSASVISLLWGEIGKALFQLLFFPPILGMTGTDQVKCPTLSIRGLLPGESGF